MAERPTIGLIETGGPPGDLAQRFGDYPAMFEALLGPAFGYRTFRADRGELPGRAEDCAAYVITGSPAGVYDPLPWIAPTLDFLRQAKGRTRLVGVCFGHQIMAEAFGGRVEKSARGWGVGLHRYDVLSREPWMDEAASIAAPASHQDQVVVVPPGARVFAASAFSPFGGLVYDDQPAISIQLHPEFDADYARALIAQRRGTRLPEDQADAATASLSQAFDRERLANWIRRFIAGDTAPG